MRLPVSAVARYVDHLPVEQLRHHYPELPADSLVDVDVVDDAETLATIPDASQDFVVASHVLEHCEDPVAAVKAGLRVLKTGGVAFQAVPDRRFTFDRDRPATPLSHVLRDHSEGPAVSRSQHYLEWVTLVDRVPEDGAPARASVLMASRYSIHFHVWDDGALRELLRHCVESHTPAASLLDFRRNRSENLAVLGPAGA